MKRSAIKMSNTDEKYLWVKSGGMCAKCKRALILEDIEKNISIGERAHIIGKGTGKKAPRRELGEENGFDTTNIDSLDNLMMLCSGCHHVIDTNAENYPPEKLFDMKKEHEGWVKNRLTQNNKAIAILHKRKNRMPFDSILLVDEIDTLLLDAVSLQKEFTDFSEEGWEEARKQNEEFFERIVQAKKEYSGTKLFVFALSPIPLLIHLGQLISDTVPVVVYQYDRQIQKWCLEDSGEVAEEQIINVEISKDKQDSLVVTVQVSGIIAEKEVSEAIKTPYQHLDIRIEKPGIDAVIYSHDIKIIKEAFRKYVYDLQDHHHFKEIHLFYYGPAGLAVELGRTINDSMLPEVHIYEHNRRGERKYTRAITI
ncbi:SAVED domain-containing protein [Peribacillus frigoritolerans]|uniref:SAVED domain-containing protein n=1 Tax=Peribacillus frigoritolerans TaxID=450367 RepID=UPI002E22E6BA|nr:SAVED domain-containing protein [Peribacillus frigoritolerans]